MELCLEMERPSSCKCVFVDDYALNLRSIGVLFSFLYLFLILLTY